jgi:hypothetical protein
MKRKELRGRIWEALQPVIHEYCVKNHVGESKAIAAIRDEVRQVFPFVGCVPRRRASKHRKTLTRSEWKPAARWLDFFKPPNFWKAVHK